MLDHLQPSPDSENLPFLPMVIKLVCVWLHSAGTKSVPLPVHVYSGFSNDQKCESQLTIFRVAQILTLAETDGLVR